MSIIYDFFLFLFVLISLPKRLLDYFFYGKYKNSLLARFGIGFPTIEKGSNKLIWIHAVSVGETKAIATLSKKFKDELNATLIISNITETGHEEAKRVIPFADYHVYLPLDFSFIVEPIVSRINPDMVILSDTDYWYHFLSAARKCKASIYLVNGKMSENSANRLKKFPLFSKPLFANFKLFCLQSPFYLERFQSLGLEDRLFVTGNMKFDETYHFLSSQEKEDLRNKFFLKEEDYCVVAGSTHDPEEKWIINAMQKVWRVYPKAKLILVPRHPERFDSVARVLEDEKLSFQRYSKPLNKETSVILVDAMGVLRNFYQLADVAIVAGSFLERVGGHNLIEPSWYGVPVVYGLHVRTQPDMHTLMQQYKAGWQVPQEALGDKLLELLDNKILRDEMKENALNMTESIKGATLKTFNKIMSCE